MNEIIVALIGAGGSALVGVLSFLGVVFTNRKSNQQMESKLITAQAVTDTKLEELTREVREHNGFARRMPVVESKIELMHEDVEKLKKYHERS